MLGKTYSKILFIGEGWGKLSNSKVYWSYEIKDRIDDAWFISAEASPAIYPSEINSLDIIFDENKGFIKLDYSFNNGIQITLKKIDDSIFGETEKILSRIKKPRNRYINEAIEYYNRLQKRLLLEKRLRTESELVKNDSMKVLKEFEEVDYVD